MQLSRHPVDDCPLAQSCPLTENTHLALLVESFHTYTTQTSMTEDRRMIL